MERELGVGLAQATQVDDALHTVSGRSLGEVLRSLLITAGKFAAVRHAVNEIVGCIHILERGDQARRFQHIAHGNLNLVHPLAPGQSPGTAPHQDAHKIAAFQQTRHQASPHVAGHAGHQDTLNRRQDRWLI